MDLRQLEYAAEILFRMCREHPEICPHDYHWCSSTTDKITGECVERYRCDLCGSEYEYIKD